MSFPQQSPEEYIAEKNIKQLLQRITLSLLENRPEDPEAHIVSMLSKIKPAEAEKWPTIDGGMVVNPLQSIATKQHVSTRRQSALSPNVLSRGGSAYRRKAMSSKMTSNTDVEIRVVPKDEATFASLEATVKKVDLFSFLQDDQRQVLVKAMFPLTFEDGARIIKQGDQPDNFYILDSGKCKVFKNTGDKEVQVALLNPGQYFGELALISGSTRAASVYADGEVHCWAIDQTTYLFLLKDGHIQKRQRYRELLKNVPLLKALQDYEVLLVADALQPVNPANGEAIVKQGENGDDFFIVLDGECTVTKIDEGETEAKIVGTVKSGGYFGELALMQNAPRAATVTAGANCKLVKLDRPSFHRLLGPCSQIFSDGMKLYESK